MQSTPPLQYAVREHRKAGRDDTKRRNRQTVLRLVASADTTTRADVARVTGLTRATVSSLVGELIDDGLIAEAGRGKSVGGKPPTLIELNRSGRQIAVADLSTSPFTGTVVDLRCEPIGPIVVANQSGDHQRDLEALLGQLTERASGPITGIGLASPGVIGGDGVVIEAANLDWHGHPLEQLTADATGLPVAVINDAHAAAVAAHHQMASEADVLRSDLLLLQIADGVGAGIILGGRLHLGSHRAAGEIGHSVVDPSGSACRCGNRGCLETIASSSAIYRRISGRVSGDADWDLLQVEQEFGSARLTESLAVAGSAVGMAVAPLVNALDIALIVISMQPNEAAERLAESVAEAVMPRVLPALRPDLRVEAASGHLLALTGAAATVLDRELGLTWASGSP